MSTDQNEEGIDITKLSISQLQQLKKQLDDENNTLAQKYSHLKLAQNRLNESKRSLEPIKPENEGKEILVPLTQSLYVPGQLQGTHKVLVDVGTGYFFEKSPEEAREFFGRKAATVQENADSLAKIIQQKRKQKQQVLQVLQARVREQVGQQ